MSAGEVSFVDFLLSIPVYPDDPRYSWLMKREAPSEPAGPETNHWIRVRYRTVATEVPAEIGELDRIAACSNLLVGKTESDRRLIMRKTANCAVYIYTSPRLNNG